MVLDYGLICKKLGSAKIPWQDYNFELNSNLSNDQPTSFFSARHRPLANPNNDVWREFSDPRLPVFQGAPVDDANSRMSNASTLEDSSAPISVETLCSRYEKFSKDIKNSIPILEEHIDALNRWRDVSQDRQGQEELIQETLQAQRATFFLNKIGKHLPTHITEHVYLAMIAEEKEFDKNLSDFREHALSRTYMRSERNVITLKIQKEIDAFASDIAIADSTGDKEDLKEKRKKRNSRLTRQLKDIKRAETMIEVTQKGFVRRFQERYGVSEKIPTTGQGWSVLWSQSRFKPGQSQVVYRLSNLVGHSLNPYEKVRTEYKIDPNDPDENWKPIIEPSIPVFNGSVALQHDQLFSGCEVDLSKVVDDGTGVPTFNFINNVRKLLSAREESKSRLTEMSDKPESWSHEGGDIEKTAHLERMQYIMRTLQETLPTVLLAHWNDVAEAQDLSLRLATDTRDLVGATNAEIELVDKWKNWMRKEIDVKSADALTGLYEVVAGLTKEDGDDEYKDYLKLEEKTLAEKARHEREAKELLSEFAKSFSAAYPKGGRVPVSLAEWKDLIANGSVGTGGTAS